MHCECLVVVVVVVVVVGVGVGGQGRGCWGCLGGHARWLHPTAVGALPCNFLIACPD